MKVSCRRDNLNLHTGREFIDFSYPLLGVGVFNSDGEMWKFHRSITRPFFHRERISNFTVFATHANEVLDRMKERARQGYAIDVQDVLSRFTLDDQLAYALYFFYLFIELFI